jgi:hypothetical protein
LTDSKEKLDAFQKAVPLDILGQSEAAQHTLVMIVAEQKNEAAQQAKLMQIQAVNQRNEDQAEFHRSQIANTALSNVERARHNLELEQLRATQNQANIPPDTLRFMAKQAWTGDTSVLQGLGYGTQGANNKIALRNEIMRLGEEMGKKPEELAAKNAEFFGIKAGDRWHPWP